MTTKNEIIETLLENACKKLESKKVRLLTVPELQLLALNEIILYMTDVVNLLNQINNKD